MREFLWQFLKHLLHDDSFWLVVYALCAVGGFILGRATRRRWR